MWTVLRYIALIAATGTLGVVAGAALAVVTTGAPDPLVLLVGALQGGVIGALLSVVAWIDVRRPDLSTLIIIAWISSLIVMGADAIFQYPNGSLVPLFFAPITAVLSYLYMRRLDSSVPTRALVRRAAAVVAVAVVFSATIHLLFSHGSEK